MSEQVLFAQVKAKTHQFCSHPFSIGSIHTFEVLPFPVGLMLGCLILHSTQQVQPRHPLPVYEKTSKTLVVSSDQTGSIPYNECTESFLQQDNKGTLCLLCLRAEFAIAPSKHPLKLLQQHSFLQEIAPQIRPCPFGSCHPALRYSPRCST